METLEPRHLLSAGLDPSFGNNGSLSGYSTLFPGGSAHAALVQPDGRILVAGGSGDVAYQSTSSDLAILRLNKDGALDPTFGNAGMVSSAFEPFSSITALKLQPDGKIIAAGFGGPDLSNTHFLVARYNTDGTPDPTFGTSGFTITPISTDDYAKALTLQPDGKIVLVGGVVGSFPGTFAAVRYTASGTPDPTFGTQGIVTLSQQSEGIGVVIQPNGGIVAALYYGPLLRLTPSGNVDPAFGLDPKTHQPITSPPIQNAALVLLKDGSLLAGGTDGGFAIARYTPSGILDRSFGRHGIAGAALPDLTAGNPSIDAQNANAEGNALAVQPDGRIVIAGSVVLNGLALHSLQAERFGAARFTPSGHLDPSFGHGGKVEFGTANLWPTDINYANAVALAPDSSVILAGNASTAPASEEISDGFAVIRCSRAGNPDPSFGYQGRVGPFPIVPPIRQIAVQPDGKAILATDSSIARVLPDGSLDPSFGFHGMILAPDDFADDAATGLDRSLVSLDIAGNGKFFVCYTVSTNFAAPEYGHIVRYNSDGTVDRTFATGGTLTLGSQSKSSQILLDALAIQPGGKLLVLYTDGTQQFARRFNASGAPDPSFGTHGKTALAGTFSGEDIYTNVLFTSDGKTVLAGVFQEELPTGPNVTTQYQLHITRLTPDGRVDASFVPPAGPEVLEDKSMLLAMADASGGGFQLATGSNTEIDIRQFDQSGNTGSVVALPLPAGLFPGNQLFFQSDGSVIATAGSASQALVLRFTSTLTPDPSFGANGEIAYTTTPDDIILGIAPAPDGSFFVAGPDFLAKLLA